MGAWLALLRPFTLAPAALGILAGSLAAVGSAARAGRWAWVDGLGDSLEAVLLGTAMAVLLAGASNVLNQVTEVELDRANKPHRPLPSGHIQRRPAGLLAAALFALALVTAWFISPEGGRWAFGCAAGAALLTVLYSTPPAYLKARGWWANGAIAVARGLLLLVAGWACVGSPARSPEPWVLGAVVALFLLGASVTKDFADMEGDRAHGIGTQPARLGLTRAARRAGRGPAGAVRAGRGCDPADPRAQDRCPVRRRGPLRCAQLRRRCCSVAPPGGRRPGGGDRLPARGRSGR